MSNETDKNDKECIEIEEREKMMNEENKAQEKIEEIETEVSKVHRTDSREGREVKPKKIPIGGIQMPGFFTRSKSKEKCKDGEIEQDGNDTEGTELLDTDVNKESGEEEKPTRVKLPFMKKTKSTDGPENEKAGDQPQRKSIINSIRLPLVSVFPKKQKSEDKSGTQSGQAGLASMETLGDDDKADKNDEMKNVKLDTDKTDIEKQDSDEESSWRTKLRAYRVVISAILLFILILIVLIALIIPGNNVSSAVIRDDKYVQAVTSCGLVEGILHDGGIAFRGIPYALPPIDEKRWSLAEPLNNIDYCWNGTFLAHNATPTCYQLTSNGSTTGIEDCLTLDIVTPYVRYTDPLPVIVMIGAENLMGESPSKMRPSASYARSRDVIFVRPNFRLGPLGFLALEMLSEAKHLPTSGNYGLSDIIQALKWVQLNIQHFGGDAKAVTLFGHRAGATLVTALAYSDHKGLFARAWATSGASIYPGKLLKESEHLNKQYLNEFTCKNAECLREQTTEKLFQAVPDTWRKAFPDLPLPMEEFSNRHEWLVLDGEILKESPAKIWTRDEKQVKLVLGSTAHAGASDYLYLRHKTWTPELIKQHIQNSLLTKMNVTDDVLNKYPLTYQGLISMVSDIRIVCPLLAISSQQKGVPFYVVTQTRGESDLADVDSDVDAILGRYEPKTPEQRRYVTAIQQLFYHYVWHGKVLQTENSHNKVLVVGQDVLPSANYTHCDFWINKDIVPKFAQID